MSGVPAAGGPAGLRALALRAATGEPAALTELVAQTSSAVWRVCAALVDPGAADDLTQETFVRAVRSLPGYRGEAEPVRWLSTIARRVCAEEIACRQRARALERALAGRRYPAGPDPMQVADVADAVARLPTSRREALLLTAVAGLSYADAAAVCGCSVGTIRSRVARARAQLRDMGWSVEGPGGAVGDVGE